MICVVKQLSFVAGIITTVTKRKPSKVTTISEAKPSISKEFPSHQIQMTTP